MGSSVEGNAALPPVTPESSAPVVAAVLGAPAAGGTAPDAALPEEVVHADASKAIEVQPDASKAAEMGSPGDDLNEEDPDAARAAKRARLDETDTEGLDDRGVVLKCLHHVQAALEHTARQAQALNECQSQIKEIGSVAYMGESAQKYSLAAVNAAANNVKSMTWQLTGSRSEEKTSCKSLIQQILTNSGKSLATLTKISSHAKADGAEPTATPTFL
eukprot:s520_g38.t1